MEYKSMVRNNVTFLPPGEAQRGACLLYGLQCHQKIQAPG